MENGLFFKTILADCLCQVANHKNSRRIYSKEHRKLEKQKLKTEQSLPVEISCNTYMNRHEREKMKLRVRGRTTFTLGGYHFTGDRVGVTTTIAARSRLKRIKCI